MRAITRPAGDVLTSAFKQQNLCFFVLTGCFAWVLIGPAPAPAPRQSICGLQHWDYHHRLSRALSACTAGQSAGRDEGEPPEWGRDFVASMVELCSGTKRPVERLKEALAVKGQL